MAGGDLLGADPIVTRLTAEDKVPWYKKPNLRVMYIWLFLCCMGVEMTSGFDSQLINTLQFSTRFNIYFGNGFKNAKGEPSIEPGMLGFISASYQLGSVFGVPIAPWMNQKYGRRWSIMNGSLIMIVGALLQGFAQHIAMYVIARMLLGLGIVFCIIAAASLIGELGHPKERAFLTSLFNSSYFIGSILAAAIALGTVEIPNDWSWRVPSLLQICPSLLQIATVFLLPESPRYLISRDRDDEAYAILIKYHAEDDHNSVLAKAEMAQIRATIKLEQETTKQSWSVVFKTPGMRRRFLTALFMGLFTQMSGNTLLSYYSNLLFEMMDYTTSYAKTRINLAYNCWGFINATIIALVVTRFKRRHMFMLSAALMCLTFMAMTICFERLSAAKTAGVKNPAAQIGALFFYFAYNPTYNIGNNALTYTYLVELFPYTVRSRGIGIQQIFGKCAGAFSQNVNPIAMTAIGWKFLAVYTGWIAFEFIVVATLYPETSGRTLEEVTFLLEDKSLTEKAVAAVEKEIHIEGHGAGATHVPDERRTPA